MSRPELAARSSWTSSDSSGRDHRLPVGHRQAARRGTEVDVLYKEYGLLIELDGRLGQHRQVAGQFRDMRRDNAATSGTDWPLCDTGSADVHGIPCRGGHPGRRAS